MKNYKELSRIFSTSFIEKFIRNRKRNKTLRILSEDFPFIVDCVSNNEFSSLFEQSYEILKNEYRSEYYYKNEVFSNILDKYDTIGNKGVLTEVKCGGSIADLVFINGTSRVFEIKTEIDTNRRLQKQVNEYSEMFKEVYVVTYLENVKKIIDLIPIHVGVLTLDAIDGITPFRECVNSSDHLKHSTLFRTLRRYEYESIIHEYYGEIPKVTDAHIYTKCLELFINIPINEAHDLVMEKLIARETNITRDKILSVPKSVRLLLSQSKITSKEKERLIQLLF